CVCVCVHVHVCATAIEQETSKQPQVFYSGEYGGNSGEHFDQSSNQLDGPITALRVRANDRYILSIQVRYGDSWSSVEGSAVGTASDQQLFLGEGFVQARGRFGSYVEYLAFRTNLGRAISFGPSSGSGTTFEAEPLFPGMVLRSIHGRSGPFINAIASKSVLYKLLTTLFYCNGCPESLMLTGGYYTNQIKI
uniref:Jacalin-type lectin domain-containing protein n=1 Tax=Varanus komodoensis TaxID=61221 RepID=A0A8D2J5Y0_VARKO